MQQLVTRITASLASYRQPTVMFALVRRGCTTALKRVARVTPQRHPQHLWAGSSATRRRSTASTWDNVVAGSGTTGHRTGASTREGTYSISCGIRYFASSSSGVARPALKPMRSVLYTPGSSRHLYKIRDIACDFSLIDLEVNHSILL